MNVVCLETLAEPVAASFLGDRVHGLVHELLSVIGGRLLLGYEASSKVGVRSSVALGI